MCATNERNEKVESKIAGLFPLFLTVLLAYMGQMILNPILAPLSREIGLKEWHIGATISLAAIMFSLTSTRWGRVSLRWGSRRTLLIGMLAGILALSGFAMVVWLGFKGLLTGIALIIGVVITRGVLYGGAIASVSPAAQTYVVTHTCNETQRVKGLGVLGAAQGFSSILGALLGGSLAAIGGFMMPLLVMPLVMLLGLAVLLLTFKPTGGEEKVAQPAKVSYFDSRVFVFLACGFLMFTAFSTVATLFGFLLQDVLKLAAGATAGLTALCMSIMGVVMILAQALVAPRLNWGAKKLFRRGLIIVLLGLLLLVYPLNLGLFIVASILTGFGLGLAMPGYNTAPTLQMKPEEQGGLAGLINANNGAAYVVAPIASTALYGLSPWLPMTCCTVLIAAAVLLSFYHPEFRK